MMNKPRVSSLVLTAAAVAAVGVSSLLAGSALQSGVKVQDVTLTGKVVDLHSFMTEKYTSTDHAKCTMECIRNGLTPALQTEQGVVVIGSGLNTPKLKVLPFAFQTVQLKGKLYEKHGLKYIDMTSIESMQPAVDYDDIEVEDQEYDPGYDEEEHDMGDDE